MGRVKDYYHDEICARANDDGPEPDDLEMLQIDYEMALERYLAALKKQDEEYNVKPI